MDDINRRCKVKTVNNVKYNNFKEAYFPMSWLDDDKEYIDEITKASHWGAWTHLHRMFATLIVLGQLSRPEVVWNSTFDNLIDDILHKQRWLLGAQGKMFC